MSFPEHDRLSERFREAASLPPEGRGAFLERLRIEEPGMAAELESLLRHDADPPVFLVTGGAAVVPEREGFVPPAIGPYRILRRIGEGGMGVVYLALQEAPVRREVAIKLIRPGFETRSVMARFEGERRALERLDHPHIARVLDAGATEDGRPYVVMEHVRGEPVTAFADRHALDLEQRLRLFVLVCEAVHHAHQNAILHRDLKPSNVLVSLVDGWPLPKIIDFGIAKALSGELEITATSTEAGQLLGTPAYMSPEQAISSTEGADTRADVYSLGCILYELLVGQPPLDAHGLKTRTPEEVRRALADLDPPAPSRSPALTAEVAERRGGDVRGLARRLRGELDWIVLKAIARERALRYASASEFAADVRRCLEGEVVDARPPSAAYRLRKLAVRYRRTSAVLAVTFPLLLAFGVAMTLQARRIAEERDRAEEVSEFLVRFYETPFNLTPRHGYMNPRVLLHNGARKAATQLSARPDLLAHLEYALGEALRQIGDSSGAHSMLREAQTHLSSLLGPDDSTALAAAHALARADLDLRRYAAAESGLHHVLAVRQRTLGATHLDTLRTLTDLGLLYKVTGRNDRAADALLQSRAGLVGGLGVGAEETVLVTSLLGAVLLDLRKLDAARTMLEESVRLLDDGHGEKGFVLYNLGCLNALQGNREIALRYLRDAVKRGFYLNLYADPKLVSLQRDLTFVEIAKMAHARGHTDRERLGLRGDLLEQEGRLKEAEALYRSLVRLSPTAENGFNRRLGIVLRKRGRYGEALSLIQQDLAGVAWQLDPTDPALADRQLELAQVRLGLGDRRGAAAAVAEAAQTFAKRSGMGSKPLVLYARASGLAIEGDEEGALRMLRASVGAGLLPGRIEDDLALAPLHGRREFRDLLTVMHLRYDLP